MFVGLNRWVSKQNVIKNLIWYNNPYILLLYHQINIETEDAVVVKYGFSYTVAAKTIWTQLKNKCIK